MNHTLGIDTELISQTEISQPEISQTEISQTEISQREWITWQTQTHIKPNVKKDRLE